jgi:hypothetical protein
MQRHLTFTHSRASILTRYAHTRAIENSLFNYCQSAQPYIPLKSKCISVLRQPNCFYQTLLEMISRARHRIFLSSLYIGSEETELVSISLICPQIILECFNPSFTAFLLLSKETPICNYQSTSTSYAVRDREMMLQYCH